MPINSSSQPKQSPKLQVLANSLGANAGQLTTQTNSDSNGAKVAELRKIFESPPEQFPNKVRRLIEIFNDKVNDESLPPSTKCRVYSATPAANVECGNAASTSSVAVDNDLHHLKAIIDSKLQQSSETPDSKSPQSPCAEETDSKSDEKLEVLIRKLCDVKTFTRSSSSSSVKTTSLEPELSGLGQ